MMDKDKFRQNVYDRFEEYQKKKAERRKAAVKYGAVAFSLLVVIGIIAIPVSHVFFGSSKASAPDEAHYENPAEGYYNIDKSGITNGTQKGIDGTEDQTPRSTMATQFPTEKENPVDDVPTEDASERPMGTELATTSPAIGGTENPTTEPTSAPLVLCDKITVYGAELTEKLYCDNVSDSEDEISEYFGEELAYEAKIYVKGDKSSDIIMAFTVYGSVKIDDMSGDIVIIITPDEKMSLYILRIDSDAYQTVYFLM